MLAQDSQAVTFDGQDDLWELLGTAAANGRSGWVQIESTREVLTLIERYVAVDLHWQPGLA